MSLSPRPGGILARHFGPAAGTCGLLTVLGLAAYGPPSAARELHQPRVEAMASPADTGAVGPRLAHGPGGRPLLSWIEARPQGGHRFRFATLEGHHWSSPRTIAEGDSFFVNWADYPGVTALATGELAAFWMWRTGADTYAYDVRVSFSRDGGLHWTPPTTPHRDATQTEHGFVSLIPEGAAARAVWLDGRKMAGKEEGSPGAEMTLRTARIDPSGALSDERELDDRTCDCCATAATRTRSGTVIAYRDRTANEQRDIALVRQVGATWSEPGVPHSDGWIIPGCPVNGPALDADGDRLALAWYTAAHESASVYVTLSPDGGKTFGAPAHVDQGRPLGRVDVALLAEGGALVSWLEAGEKTARIQNRVISAAGVAGPIWTIATTSSRRASGFPRILRVGSTILAAWTEAGSPSRIKLARYQL